MVSIRGTVMDGSGFAGDYISNVVVVEVWSFCNQRSSEPWNAADNNYVSGGELLTKRVRIFG